MKMENAKEDIVSRIQKIESTIDGLLDIVGTIVEVADVREGVWEEHDRWELEQCQKKLEAIKENWGKDDEAI